jgi:hypothetical protein
MDYLKIEDHTNNICYNFSCDDWFSSDSKDKNTTRILNKKSSTTIASERSSSSSSSSSSSTSSRSLSSIDISEAPRNKASRTSTRSKSPQKVSERKSSSSMKKSSSQQESRSKIVNRSQLSNHSSSTARSPSSSSSSYSSASLPRLKSAKKSSTSDDHESRKIDLSPPPRVQKDESPSKKASSSSIGNTKTGTKSPKETVQVISSNREKLSAIEAVEMNQLEILKAIIAESPAEMNKTDVRGKTLMCIACENGFESIVKYLAENNDSLLTIDTPTGRC